MAIGGVSISELFICIVCVPMAVFKVVHCRSYHFNLDLDYFFAVYRCWDLSNSMDSEEDVIM